jgi:hypothetical protein
MGQQAALAAVNGFPDTQVRLLPSRQQPTMA